MKWIHQEAEQCLFLSNSAHDVLQDILCGTYDALKVGMLKMSPSELTDFNQLCEAVGMTLTPLAESQLPGLRRIK